MMSTSIRRIGFALLLAGLFFSACKKDDKPDTELFLPGSMKDGSMQADKTALDHNTVKWAGGGFARRDSAFLFVPPRVWVEIAQIDTIAKTVSGKFDINFKIGDQYLDRDFPASIRFSNGVFNLKIVNGRAS